jgi:hypothetical protein
MIPKNYRHRQPVNTCKVNQRACTFTSLTVNYVYKKKSQKKVELAGDSPRLVVVADGDIGMLREKSGSSYLIARYTRH